MAGAVCFDELKMFFGGDFRVNEFVSVHTPTVGEIVEFGEREYFSVVSALTAIPSDMKSVLFDMGIDYEEISDFELFYILSRGLPPRETSILLGELDLSRMGLFRGGVSGGFVMVNGDTGEFIDEDSYLRMAGYIRKLHGFKPKVERAANRATKDILIKLDRERRKKNAAREYVPQLKPLVSAMMRYPGFKYKSCELRDCSIYEFMDTVAGARIFVASTALLNGCYCGMVDTGKVNRREFDWMRGVD